VTRDVNSLEVFRRAYDLSIDIHRATLLFPRIEQFGGIADQLRRSSKSVCSLLVEGSGRQGETNTEFRRYVRMAIGSADEAKLWCRYAEDLGYVAHGVAEAWRETFAELARMLQGLLKHLSEN
jgi:four helix bundle protein